MTVAEALVTIKRFAGLDERERKLAEFISYGAQELEEREKLVLQWQEARANAERLREAIKVLAEAL